MYEKNKLLLLKYLLLVYLNVQPNTIHADTINKTYMVFAVGKPAVLQKLKIGFLSQVNFSSLLVFACNALCWVESDSEAASKCIGKEYKD